MRTPGTPARARAHLHLALVCALASALAAAPGCATSDQPEPAVPEPEVISVEALAHAVSGGACAVYDANTPAVRTRFGRIPQATLLRHYRDYPLDVLPADKDRPLVFYCANERCSASDASARTALRAGYRNVSVLRAGIAGWAKAGHDTQPVE